MLSPDNSVMSYIGDKTHRYATLWRITRTDGVIFRFTDHDAIIEFESETFTPVGGFDTSAVQKQSGLRTANIETRGIISSSSITEDDLRAGRYREAQVDEILVNWRYPWAGSIHQNKYWINEVSFSEAFWVGQLTGPSRWLRPSVGGVISPLCRYDIGDENCRVDLTDFDANGAVSVITSRRIFTTNLTSQPDNFFNDGKLTWLTGNNVNLFSEIQDYRQSDKRFILWIPTPFDIQVGDTFTVHQGCNKLLGHADSVGHCINRFDNHLNFGGEPFIPGINKARKTPNV